MSEGDKKRDDPSVGLIGGHMDERLAHSKVPPLDLPAVLAPFRRPDDQTAFEAFVAHAPLHVEIGFGRPHYLCDLAAMTPEAHVLGFEIRRRWCRDAARRAARMGLENVRVIEGDVRAYTHLIAGGSVDGVHVQFPDPWWKKRHHKRRIFRPDFLVELGRLVRPGTGYVVVKTDVPAYAELVRDIFADAGGWRMVPDDPRLAELPLSHREKKCRELEVPVVGRLYLREG